MRISLRTRLTLLFLAIAIFPVLLVGIIIARQIVVAQTSQAIANQEEVARRVAAVVHEYLKESENELQSLIEVRNLQYLPRPEIKRTFTDLLSFSKIYKRLTLTDQDGNEMVSIARSDIVTSDQELGNIKGSAEFDTPLGTKEIYYSEIKFDENTGEPYLTISIPITSLRTDNVTGVLIADLGFKTVWEIMTTASQGGQSLFLVDKNNQVVAHSNPSIVLQGSQFQHPETSQRTIGLDNPDAILGIAPVAISETEDFYTVAELPTNQALALSYQFMFITGGVIAITLFAIIAFSIWETHQITRPIEELAQAATAISKGELDTRVNIKNKDEIGVLGNAFNQMAAELQSTLQGLEKRVAERTQSLEEQSSELTLRSMQLEEVNAASQKRANQFETISTVMRSTASIQSLDTLLKQIANLISDRFGYYHVGIFLADDMREFAVLSATNSESEGGQRMLTRGHRLKIGKVGIVGNVVGSGKARIALDTGIDATYFNNPDLPETHSEMAIPLRLGATVIGALDVQSREQDAFTQEDINVLEILADQVSIAIQNARLFESTEKALANAESISRQNTRAQWANISKGTKRGYEYSILGSKPLQESIQSPEVEAALSSRQTQIAATAEANIIAVPVILRGETIGVISLRVPAGRQLLQSEVDITQAIAERVAISADNARLFEESQRRATKEQTIGQITAKIGASVNLQNILQTAVEEIGHVIPGSEVVIEIKKTESNNASG